MLGLNVAVIFCCHIGKTKNSNFLANASLPRSAFLKRTRGNASRTCLKVPVLSVLKLGVVM